MKVWTIITGILIALLAVFGTIFNPFNNDEQFLTGSGGGVGNYSTNKVIKLDFDNTSSCGQNNAVNGITATTQGTASCLEDTTICKWYGCGNFTSTSGDYFNLTNNFALTDEMTVSFWIYPTTEISGVTSQAFWEMSTGDFNADPNYKASQEGGYGINNGWNAVGGKVGAVPGDTQASATSQWTHYCSQYDGSRFVVYKNGVVIVNNSQAYGNLNYSSGEVINIGKANYGIDLIGYMDEFELWNSSSVDCITVYREKSLGTPPDLDLFIQNVTYNLSVLRTESKNNSYVDGIGDVLPINITIKNQGVSNASGNVTVKLYLDGTLAFRFDTNISPESSIIYQYNWTVSWGYHTGYLIIDEESQATEDEELNNRIDFWIPIVDHPYLIVNQSEWDATLRAYAIQPNNVIAYSGYNWYKSFSSSAFDNAYSCTQVDPYGKKGRESAVSAFITNYTSATFNDKAINHVLGWANRTTSVCIDEPGDVQATHEFAQVLQTFDLMYPNMTQAEINLAVTGLYDKCISIMNMENVRPDLDPGLDTTNNNGGNGWGFGQGFNTMCTALIGENPNNPLMIQPVTDRYWSLPAFTWWEGRTDAFLRSRKNDSYSQYQEGSNYKSYAEHKLMEQLWIEKKNNLSDRHIEFQEAYCGIAREYITTFLTFEYNGNTLRSDENRNYSRLSRGDSNSYEDIGSDTELKYGTMTYAGLLCDDIETKKAILYLRNVTYYRSNGGTNIVDIFLYKQLLNQVDGIPSNIDNYSYFTFDKANDIVTFRSSNNLMNDTIVEIDGGEERGGGHATKANFVLCPFGVCFQDYEQVSNANENIGGSDDVRAEDFGNGISFQNRAATQGSRDTYNQDYGVAVLNQYYGGILQVGSYPDFRLTNTNFTGDLDSYNGNKDFMGVTKWMPYAPNNKNNTEIFVLWEDVIARHVIVESSNTEKIYDNTLFILEEYNVTVTGNNFTSNRIGTTKNLTTSVIWSNTSILGLVYENSTYKYSFTKTGTPGGKGYYGRTILNISAPSVQFIRGYNWYLLSNQTPMTELTTTDKGMKAGNKHIYFDTSGNGVIDAGWMSSDGDSAGYNNVSREYFANGATYLKNGTTKIISVNDTSSFFLKTSNTSFNLTVNTMKRANYIDFPQPMQYSVNITGIVNKSVGITVDGVNVNYTNSTDVVTFTVTSKQVSSDVIILSGAGQGEQGGEGWSECASDIHGIQITNLTSASIPSQSCLVNTRSRYNKIQVCTLSLCV